MDGYVMLDLIRNNRELATKFLNAGFFWSDLTADTGTTSKALRSLGFSDREMRDGTYQQRLHPDDRETYFALWDRLAQGLDDTLYVEYRLSDREAAWHWVETHAVVIAREDDGTIRQLVGTDRIIDGRKNAQLYLERQVRESTRKLQVAESLFTAGTIASANQDLSRRLYEASHRLMEIIGFERCDVYSAEDGALERLVSYPSGSDEGEAPIQRLAPQLRDTLYPVITDEDPALAPYRSALAIPLQVNESFIGIVHLRHRTPGFYRGADLFTGMSAATVFAVALHNHQFYRRTVSELERDELTGFFTRRSFDRDAAAIWGEFGDLYRDNAVAMIDIDHFKGINDRYGHQQGDEVIRAVARVIHERLRKDDVLGRYGGEEFVAILPNCGPDAAFESMERVRSACAALDVCEFAGNVTVSIGIASASGDPRDLTALIGRADAALYRAKGGGRNRVVVG
jgi:diguanylate cyclase (GGDEF)-like protein